MIEEASTRAAAAADGILARPPRADSALRAPHNAPSLAKFTTTLQWNLLAHISFTLIRFYVYKTNCSFCILMVTLHACISNSFPKINIRFCMLGIEKSLNFPELSSFKLNVLNFLCILQSAKVSHTRRWRARDACEHSDLPQLLRFENLHLNNVSSNKTRIA